MEWTPATRQSVWGPIGLAMRAVKVVANGSVFYWLTLPLFAFASCNSPGPSYTGYQTLHGVPLPAAQFGVTPGFYPSYAPNYWVVWMMLFAVVGIASAWHGGLRWSLAGGIAALAGLQGLEGAIVFYNPPHPIHYWTPEPGAGGIAIGFAFSLALLAEAGSLSARGWYEVKRQKIPPSGSSWGAMGCLGAIFCGVLGVTLLTVLAAVLVRAALHH